MRRHAGFTLIELMVVIAILGIMAATAIPVYRTWQQRATGSEAAYMVKKILELQIIYFLEHDKFFPEDGSSISIFHDDLPNKQEILDIKDALNILIPVGHTHDNHIQTFPDTGDDFCQVTVSANFPLFKGGYEQITAEVNKDGTVDVVFPP